MVKHKIAGITPFPTIICKISLPDLRFKDPYDDKSLPLLKEHRLTYNNHGFFML